MKTIHRLIAAGALVLAPMAVFAQSAGTTTTTTTSGTTTTTGGDVGATGSGTSSSDVGASGSGTSGSDVGASGTGTSEVGASGTGTSEVGASGTGTSEVGATGTGTNSVGSSGTGTGTSPTTMTSSPTSTTLYEPTVTLLAKSTSLRTPGSMPVTVVLSADASLSPAQARDISVPLSSSSTACVVPSSVIVSWSSTNGGTATVNVACSKAGAQTVTITSGTATTGFSIK